jgi:hypothetical protein
MKVLSFCVVAGLAIGASFAASAQSASAGAPADVKYCNALARSYQSMWPPQEGMPVGDVVQLSRCDSETTATIAFLEKKLADKRIDLPQHEGVAQPSGSSPGNTR